MITLSTRKLYKKPICQLCGGKLERIQTSTAIFYCLECGVNYFYDTEVKAYKIIISDPEKEIFDQEVNPI